MSSIPNNDPPNDLAKQLMELRERIAHLEGEQGGNTRTHDAFTDRFNRIETRLDRIEGKLDRSFGIGGLLAVALVVFNILAVLGVIG